MIIVGDASLDVVCISAVFCLEFLYSSQNVCLSTPLVFRTLMVLVSKIGIKDYIHQIVNVKKKKV